MKTRMLVLLCFFSSLAGAQDKPKAPVPQKQQEKVKVAEPKKPERYIQGPYDRKGNYRYTPAVRKEDEHY
jgi:hypothetical protein